jgi:pyruvate dehydrogenase E1 component alpha subunit
MEYTPISEVTAVPNPGADRASAYGLESVIVDGNDADAMYAVAVAALEKARSGGGPSLLEVQTYRHGGHSRADPGKYRPDEEVAAWKARDPVVTYRQRLLDDGVDVAELDAIDAEQSARVDAAEETARNSGPPSLDIAETNLWADGSSTWRN